LLGEILRQEMRVFLGGAAGFHIFLLCALSFRNHIHSTPETRAKILGKMENNDECCASCTQVLYECTHQDFINFSISFGSMSSGLYALSKI
jgi:hypothetical protein